MNYQALVASIQQVHNTALSQAARAVNRSLILRNWLIGAWLVEFEQHGDDRAKYGVGLLKQLAKDLTAERVPGCSRQMLDRMRLFYAAYPQLADIIRSPQTGISDGEIAAAKSSSLMSIFGTLPPRISQSPIDPFAKKPNSQTDSSPSPLPPQELLCLSWTHIIELLSLDDPWKRAFYENECLEGGWSVRQLQRQIGSLLYERTGMSSDKQTVIQTGRNQAAEHPQSIQNLIRDPYVIEFTGLAEKSHYLERDLETLLLDHLQSFLLELGAGFCFEGRQKRITVGNEHDYIDLVFYHRILRCHLLIDLKVRTFQHGDAGQMNFYLNFWKDQVMQPGDQPPVGLILCADKDQPRVDYATAGIDHQLFVSRYLNSLPSIETLQNLIERDTATWLQIREEAAEYKANFK